MNTNQLKPFARKARNIIRDGVTRQLIYWGFDENGIVQCKPERVEGGVIHREQVIDDQLVLKQWDALHSAVKHHGFDQIVEEAAYTWFNRLMAIRILAKNGYDIPQLEYSDDGAETPLILQRARRGQYAFLNKEEQIRLSRILTDYTQEAKAFSILITGYCHSHILLNNVFGRMDDYTEMLLPTNILSETGFIHFLNTSTSIDDEDYKKVELIGWLYQFYISEKKDQVFKQFKKNQKAEAKDIPAATQIFTPNWIVKYMVENTVGKIWMDKHPDSPIKTNMKYLVESPTENEVQQKTPLISEVAQLKLLDPAAGSAHILVEGFELLYQMYLEEYYMPEEAVESILKNNLFGLDIDLRAAQLAQFAILVKAATKYPEILKKNILPKVLAMPAPADFSRQEILDFLGDDGRQYEEKLTDALELMQQAQNLGSVMKFDLTDNERNYLVTRLDTLKTNSFRDTFEEAILQKITPFIEVLTILTNRYEAIAANPPYMGSGNMNNDLKLYINQHYPYSKNDLFAVFIEVMIDHLRPHARLGCITMESWMFLSSYEKLRKYILEKYSIVALAHFGWHIIGIAFGTASLILENSKTLNSGQYSYLTIDDIDKDKNIPIVFPKNDNGRFANISQSNFNKIPGSPIAYWTSQKLLKSFLTGLTLKSVANPKKGLATTDNNRFLRLWFEVKLDDFGTSCFSRDEALNSGKKWFPINKGGRFRKWYGNKEYVINWYNDGKELKDAIIKRYNGGSYTKEIRSEDKYFKNGITWSALTSNASSFRYTDYGALFDSAGSTMNPTTNTFLLLALLNSPVVCKILGVLNPTLNFGAGTVANIPIILPENTNSIESKAKHIIEIVKKDWDAKETSWDFAISPLLDGGNTLKLSFQKWLHNSIRNFFQLHADEEELNRIFIDIYGLNNELDPVVPLKDITILQDELDVKLLEKTLHKKRKWELVDGKWERSEDEKMELPPLPIKNDVVMKQLISYAIGCMMGRYRLDKQGLHIAHPNPTVDEVCTYTYNNYNFEIDDDAILPLMGTNCTFADDAVNRLSHFIEVVWGADTLTDNKNFLVECLNQDIEKYLVKYYWKDHCKAYKKKPIYWLFSSDKGAFQVLVYMHRMNKFAVEKIRSKYLLKHLLHLQEEKQRLEDNSASLSRDDLKKLDTIRTQYNECERYELLLKDYADRQIEFDLDDGVTVNYELFKGVVAPIK